MKRAIIIILIVIVIIGFILVLRYCLRENSQDTIQYYYQTLEITQDERQYGIELLELTYKDTTNKYYKQDYIPDEKTAIEIAEAIWFPIYGKNIYNSKPFRATIIQDSVWYIRGTLEDGYVGGVPYALIRKSDCKVLKVIHTK
jgi:hypothetical protein